MPATSNFSGFPKECVTFFSELAENNSKIWFERHKQDYENSVLAPPASLWLKWENSSAKFPRR